MQSFLRQSLILVRDVRVAVEFYGPGGLGLPLKHATDSWAELGSDESTCSLALKQTNKEAELCRGFSPMLCFDVADVDELLPNLILKGPFLSVVGCCTMLVVKLYQRVLCIMKKQVANASFVLLCRFLGAVLDGGVRREVYGTVRRLYPLYPKSQFILILNI